MKRNYLFLQGPHGPFLKQLGQRIKSNGHCVLRVNFNGGDWVDWVGSGTIDYRGTNEEWPAFCDQLYEDYKITDLVLYGDCRVLHRQAIEKAGSHGIQVHAFEEGYLRPDWITLEEEGVNGHSSLSKSPEFYFSKAKNLKTEKSQKVGPSMRWVLLYCLRFYLFKTLLSRRFKAYVRHRPYYVTQELFLWMRCLLRMPLLRWRSDRRCRQLHFANKPYYLVGMQLDSDAQLRVHSSFPSVASFLSTVLKSFAQHAPADSLLVMKKHPLDPGAVSYETLSRIEASSLGIRDRVVFLHAGCLPDLIQSAKGVVVVNSTMGTSALHHGCPTIALGEAVYHMEGLTWRGGLDHFWTEGTVPDKSLYKAFRTYLLCRALINGGFFSPRGRRLALNAAVEKLSATKSCTLVSKHYPIQNPVAPQAQKAAVG